MGSEEWRQWQLEWLPSPIKVLTLAILIPTRMIYQLHFSTSFSLPQYILCNSTNKEQEFIGFTTQVPTAVGGKRLLTALKLRWGGVHYSDAANNLIANQIMGGSFSDSPVSIAEACRNPPRSDSTSSG
ncbi:hypothetical protein ACFX15_020730 [Malus domestica]